MEYKRFKNTILARLNRGEEVISSLLDIAKKEKIKLASVSAIGATNDFTLGVFESDEKKYFSTDYKGSYEIVSLLGNLSLKDNEPYAHLHMTASNREGVVVGGHLNRAVISVTCEIFINIIDIDIKVDRKFSDEIGINLFSF